MRLSSVATRFALLGLLTLGIGSTARAADLKEIYDLAVNNDPQLAAAKATYMSRREVISQARAGMLPNLSASLRTTQNERTSPEATADPLSPGGFTVSDVTQKYNDNSWSAVLSQPVFNLRRWFQFTQSKDIEAQAAANFAAEQQDLIFRVADSYLAILEAQDRLSASMAERDAVKRQLEQVQQRFDVGLVAITDVLESTAAFDSSTVNVIEAEGAQVITFDTLLRLTGQPFTLVSGLSDEFPVVYPDPRDEDAWVKAALENNLSIAAAQEAVDAAHRGLQVVRSDHLPTVDARITYTESTSSAQSIFTGQTEATAASLVLNVPVFSGFLTHSQAKQAAYDLQHAQRTLDLTRRTVVENTRNLYSAINTDVARVQARLRGIESSQSALDATQTGYEVGTRNIVDVLLAQQRLYQAQFQYASARYQYVRDTLSLKQVVGSLSPDDIYDLNNFIVATKSVGKIKPATR